MPIEAARASEFWDRQAPAGAYPGSWPSPLPHATAKFPQARLRFATVAASRPCSLVLARPK